jgi:hypothetical protein
MNEIKQFHRDILSCQKGPLKVYIEKPPREAYSDFQEITITLANERLQTQQIQAFMPEYWRIVEHDHPSLHTDPERKLVCIPHKPPITTFLTQQGSLLGLFHEIGHAHIDEMKDPEYFEQDDYLRETYAIDGFEAFTLQQQSAYTSIVWKSEYDAWMFTLSKTQQLQQRGFTIEQGMNNQNCQVPRFSRTLSMNFSLN